MKKTVKVVTITIEAKKLYEEQEGVLLFKSGARSKLTMIPKKCIYNFEKVITTFTSWKGKSDRKAFRFDIPLWYYLKIDHKLKGFFDSIIIENTHK